MRPGVTIDTHSSEASATAVSNLSTMFTGGSAPFGPTGRSVFVNTFAEFEAIFGTRAQAATQNPGSVATWDGLRAYFLEGGQRVGFTRVTGATPVASSKTLLDDEGEDTIKVAVRDVGAWYNAWKVAIIAGTVGNTFKIRVTDETDVIKSLSPNLASPAAAVAWGATDPFVVVTDLESETAAPDNNPVVLAATALSGGNDDLANINSGAAFSTMTGPGQVVVAPQAVGDLFVEESFAVMAAGIVSANLVAIMAGATDAADAAFVTDLRDAMDEEGAARLSVVRDALAYDFDGVERIVEGAYVLAALIARNDQTNRPSQPAAGAWGITRNAKRIVNESAPADIETLNEAGLINFRTIDGRPRAYGFRTISPLANRRSLADARTIMAVTDSLQRTAEGYVFARVDSRGKKLADYQGALMGDLAGFWQEGDLYGDTATEAFSVDIGPAANTPETIAAGELHARCGLKTTPFAEAVFVDIAKAPITEGF